VVINYSLWIHRCASFSGAVALRKWSEAWQRNARHDQQSQRLPNRLHFGELFSLCYIDL